MSTAEPAAVWKIAEEHRTAIPPKVRTSLGIFYTPPEVADRLIADLEMAGARFDGSQRFCDPACGGGAFLLPVARRIAERLQRDGGTADDLAACLVGMDLDPGGLAITRSALDTLAMEHFGRLPKWDLRQWNTLRQAVVGEIPRADVVIGNPPFGRVRLTASERAFFNDSVRGHANLYGLFVDVAFRITNGLVGYVMPTSWLAGDYFAGLRELVSSTRPLCSLRFISSRTGIFEGVLQEMCLAVFAPRGRRQVTRVFEDLTARSGWTVHVAGSAPWFIARCRQDVELVAAATRHGYRLADCGYGVHTGRLVWNRHKDRLRTERRAGTVPIVWADAVRASQPVDYRLSRRAHRYFSIEGMTHLLLQEPAVLVKRTTAKEQPRRIVAAPFFTPPAVVENHLNMITANGVVPKISIDVLAELLNSSAVDRLFRCVSGTVAVSALELQSLPLPPPDALSGLLETKDRDAAVLEAYMGGR